CVLHYLCIYLSHTICFPFFSFSCALSLCPLHSFPTRRSSDLAYAWVELLMQFVVGHVEHADIGPGFLLGPVGQRIEFFQAISFIDRKSTRLNSSHRTISYAVFCLKKKKKEFKFEFIIKYTTLT